MMREFASYRRQPLGQLIKLPQSLRALTLRGAAARVLRPTGAMIAATAMINLLGLALPLAVMETYDSIIPKQAHDALAVLAIGFFTAIVLEAVLRSARSIVGSCGAAAFEQHAMTIGFARLLATSARADETAARRLARLKSVSRVADFHHGPLRWAFLDLAFVPIFVALIAVIGGGLAFVLAALLGVFMWLHTIAANRFAQAAARLDAEMEKIQDFIAECLTAAPQIKATAAEAFMERRLERLAGRSAQLNERLIRAAADSEKLSSLMGNVTLVTMVAVGGVLAVADGMTAGGVIACMLLVARVVQPSLRAASALRSLRDLERAVRDVDALMTTVAPAAAAPVIDPNRGLEVRGLVPPGVGAAPVSFAAPVGSIVALMGADRSARSAVLQTIAGQAAPAAGEALFNGATAQSLSEAGSRRIILVSADSALFTGSLLDNLTLFGRGPRVEEVEWACRLIGLDVEIARLPAGYRTMVGEGFDATLPAALIKQTAIARAIAMRPQLLILDEPQAGLDQRADGALLNGLAELKGRMTVVIGSDRPSYLALADQRFDVGSERSCAPLTQRQEVA